MSRGPHMTSNKGSARPVRRSSCRYILSSMVGEGGGCVVSCEVGGENPTFPLNETLSAIRYQFELRVVASFPKNFLGYFSHYVRVQPAYLKAEE